VLIVTNPAMSAIGEAHMRVSAPVIAS
jgi:hypothetical protein